MNDHQHAWGLVSRLAAQGDGNAIRTLHKLGPLHGPYARGPAPTPYLHPVEIHGIQPPREW